MGKQFDRIGPEHRAFIDRQKIFFVASAAPMGRVNVSPKGLSSLRVLGSVGAAAATSAMLGFDETIVGNALGAAKDWGLSVYAPIIIKYRDDKTEASVKLEEFLR